MKMLKNPGIAILQMIQPNHRMMNLRYSGSKIFLLYQNTGKILLLLISLVFVLSVPLRAENNTILSIDVQGNNETSINLIKAASTLSSGENFTLGNIEQAVKNIYRMGMFEDVKIVGERSPQGLNVIITVKEYPRLQKVEFSGNKVIKEKKLSESVSIDSMEFVSPQKVKEAIVTLRKLYQEKGYVNSTIKTEPFESSGNRLILRFIIDEGERIRVKSIDFEGNNSISGKKLRKKMETHQKGLFRSGEYNEETFREDKNTLIDFYHKNGYINAEIITDTSWVAPNGEDLFLKIIFDEGDQYYFGEVDILGNSVFPVDKIKGSLTFEKGEIFSSEKLEESLANIYFLYQEDGYIFTQINDQKELVDSSANLILNIFEGQQARVNRIDITGNTRTYEKVIRREFAILPGEVFKRSKLIRTQRNVYYLNYFEDVRPDFEVLDNGDVNLEIQVVEKPIGRFQVGAGYNSRDNLVGTISVGWPNVLGRGWETEFSWEFGKQKQNLSFSFTEPWFLDTPTTVGLDLYNSLWKWSNYYTEQRRGGALRLGRRLRWPDDYFTVYLRYRLEQVSYFDFDDSYTPSYAYDLRSIDWPKLRSATRFTIKRDSRDSQLFANEGNMNSYSIEFAGNLLGGDEDFEMQSIQSNWYFKIWEYLIFVTKVRFGFLTNWMGNPDDVPFGERFFPGGVSYDGQLRGYDDRKISPIDYTDEEFDSTVTPDASGEYPMDTPSYPFRIGGRAMMILSTELRVPIAKDQLYFSVFSDMGNSWLRPSYMRSNDLYKSVGVGARLVAPLIGVIGFDAAYGLDDLNGDGDPEGWNFHFQIGPEY
ncbi:outer membrane protein assembly factor BamA [bacterium]|nr:outer membrane protein assembly factor BamA [bacterium]